MSISKMEMVAIFDLVLDQASKNKILLKLDLPLIEVIDS